MPCRLLPMRWVWFNVANRLYATDPHVISALGVDKDEVIGFLYLGTREGPSKLTPALDPEDYITHF